MQHQKGEAKSKALEDIEVDMEDQVTPDHKGIVSLVQQLWKRKFLR